MIKQAVILAAGSGTRMKDGTNDEYILSTPKPLLKVRGTPIIEKIVKRLNQSGIEIGIVINPKDESLFREALKNYNILYYYQNEPKGTAHALFSAKEFVTQDMFLVQMGDDVSNFDIDDLLKTDVPMIFGFSTEQLKEYGSIKLDKDGYAEMIIEKKISGPGIANCGIYVMPKEFFKIYDKILPNQTNGEFYLTEAVNLLYEFKRPLFYKKLEFWTGINRLKDLENENTFHRSELKIRPAKMIDIYSLVFLLSQLSSVSYNYISLENVKRKLEAILLEKNTLIIVAEYHGDILGTATLLLQNNLSHGGRPYAHIENVVTREDVRGFGIGLTMINELIKNAKEKDCYKIVLTCKPENIEFYRRNGFNPSGEVEMRLDL
ncbi:MAG: GNAT family N-acetyltransferase [Cuniculiplasma sp.]|jgi:dTDP-glucose pyrophosphorylase